MSYFFTFAAAFVFGVASWDITPKDRWILAGTGLAFAGLAVLCFLH